jgi:murein DD-endopeptidase
MKIERVSSPGACSTSVPDLKRKLMRTSVTTQGFQDREMEVHRSEQKNHWPISRYRPLVFAAIANRRIATIVLLLTASFAYASDVVRQSFDIAFPFAPTAVETEGHWMLSYELHLTNFAAHPLTIRAVHVYTGDVALTVIDETLGERSVVVGRTRDASASTIAPGERAIVFIEFALSEPVVPSMLRHDIDYTEEGGKDLYTVHAGNVSVDRSRPIVLGPPLRGGPWAAVHSPSWPRGHRRFVYALFGKAHIPGRYAIDFVGLNEEGLTTSGSGDVPSEAIAYGAPVFSAADASVAAIRDGIAESSSIKGNASHPIGQGAGNYVVLRIAEQRYVFYEHLRPGSVRVKVGEHVSRGEIIGNLGFTGDSTGPHLHVHVADGVDPLNAEGLPFVFDRYEELGRYPNIGDLGKKKWQAGEIVVRQVRSHEWPGPNVVSEFDPR